MIDRRMRVKIGMACLLVMGVILVVLIVFLLCISMLADFGLAREKKTNNSIMRSVVGTISYSCPEIIQHQEYSDKADIW